MTTAASIDNTTDAMYASPPLSPTNGVHEPLLAQHDAGSSLLVPSVKSVPDDISTAANIGGNTNGTADSTMQPLRHSSSLAATTSNHRNSDRYTGENSAHNNGHVVAASPPKLSRRQTSPAFKVSVDLDCDDGT
jgi:hypothetical protein